MKQVCQGPGFSLATTSGTLWGNCVPSSPDRTTCCETCEEYQITALACVSAMRWCAKRASVSVGAGALIWGKCRSVRQDKPARSIWGRMFAEFHHIFRPTLGLQFEIIAQLQQWKRIAGVFTKGGMCQYCLPNSGLLVPVNWTTYLWSAPRPAATVRLSMLQLRLAAGARDACE